MTTTCARALVLLLGVLLGLATLVAPAHAAQDEAGGDFCAAGVGISVTVDASALDGDVTRACVAADGEQSASQVLQDAGLDVTPVGAFPGAVCQVDGLPADVPCAQMPSGNAYWGLFLAGEGTGTGDGSGDGAWDYAPVGVDELRLSPGDYVGFAWQTSAEPAPPGVEPVAGEATATATSTGEESAEPSPGGGVTVQSTPGTDADEAADSGASDGAPVWIFFVIVVVLAVTGLVVALVRNRRK